MNTERGNKIPDDEIDLSRVSRRLTAAIVYPFALLRKHLFITALFLLAAIAFCVALKYSLPRTYKSSFIIRPNDGKEKFHLRILGDIQTLLKYRDLKSVAAELKISDELAGKIAALQLYNPTLKNTPDSVNYTEVIITTGDYNSFLPLQSSLLQYIENSPYFLKIKKLSLQQVAAQLEQVNKDLMQLDSLKSIQIRHSQHGQTGLANTLVLNELINPTALYAMSTEKINKKTSLMAQQAFQDNFQLIKSCVVVKQHTSPPRILVMLVYVIPVFLLLCFLFLHFRFRNRYITADGN